MAVTHSAKPHTLANGTANDASEVEENFTTSYSNHAATKVKIDSLLNGNVEDGTSLTLNSNHTGSPSATCSFKINRGSSTDVDVRWNETNDEWELTNDGTNYLRLPSSKGGDPGSPAAGQFWYNRTDGQTKLYDNGVTKPIVGVASNYSGSISPVWVDATTVRIPQGAEAIDSTGVTIIRAAADLDVDLSASGALGLDTGTEANDTWYYLWLCSGSSGVTAVFSTTSTAGSVTAPSGYDDFLAMVMPVRNDGSGNILPFDIIRWGGEVEVFYPECDADTASTPYMVLVSGTATTYTDIDCSALIPPSGVKGYFAGIISAASGGTRTLKVRKNGTSTDGEEVSKARGDGFTASDANCFPLTVDTNQIIEYLVSSGGTGWIAVKGYVWRRP